MDTANRHGLKPEEARQGNVSNTKSVELLDLALNDFAEFKRQVLRKGKNDRARSREDDS
jgi:hypothetical protein